MSKLTVTNFTKRTGSPFSKNETIEVKHEEVLQKSPFEKQKEKQSELLQKVNKKTAEYQSNKPSSGVFTEVTTSGAFTSKNTTAKEATKNDARASPPKNISNGNGSKGLLGFPSSANDLALDAKSDLEADANISKETKDKVIEKLFTLVSMVQHVFESKVRIMQELEKYKDTHMKNEIRREKEHSEQLYKLNMNFQNEVVQSIQRLKSEIDISRNVSENVEEKGSANDTSIEFTTKSQVSEENDIEIKEDDKSEGSEE
ncbi:uncharacterized protein LOC134674987 [Cydia fagiglandana]|uniref:uncharacterized protein LOC134674987 n=1 Tax=Cydia fagiglandana TaxID=1458189 RepID=UPI002FEE1246